MEPGGSGEFWCEVEGPHQVNNSKTALSWRDRVLPANPGPWCKPERKMRVRPKVNPSVVRQYGLTR
jgi:hypothetical protein